MERSKVEEIICGKFPHLRWILDKYEPQIEYVKVGDKTYKIVKPSKLDFLLEEDTANTLDFPYWVKIWDASIVFSEFLQANVLPQDKSVLELGAGLGLCGLVMADLGFHVTLTDYKEEILAFQYASSCVNGLTNLNFELLDWRDPKDLGKFDLIIGSELIFHRDLIEPLCNTIKSLTKENSLILLCEDISRLTLKPFLDYASQSFEIGVIRRELPAKRQSFIIIRMKNKERNT